MLKTFKLVCYLHWKYKIRPAIRSVSGCNTNGSFWANYDIYQVSGRSFVDKVNVARVYNNWLHSKSFITFLHEVGHVSQFHRAAKHKFTQSHLTETLFAEKRASIWAIRVAKVVDRSSQVDINYLNWCYGTYIGYYLKEEDPMKKADVSYRVSRLFGVRY